MKNYQGSEDLVHRLFKIEPDDNPRKCRIEFVSNYLAEKIRERLEDISGLDRKQLYDWLGSSGLASAFRGFVYEEYFHSCMVKGHKLLRRKIDEKNFSEFTFEKSCVLRFSKLSDISLQNLGYSVPTSRCLQSIDSVLHQEYVDALGHRHLICMVFQIYIQEFGHPIDADGLVKYLEAVKMYDHVQKNPQAISINFVIPSSLDSSYMSPQAIEGVRPKDFSLILHDVMSLHGFGGYGIRKASLEKILKMGISTVSELKLRFQANEDSFSFERVRLRRLFADMDLIPRDLGFLLNIPQYVIHLDVR